MTDNRSKPEFVNATAKMTELKPSDIDKELVAKMARDLSSICIIIPSYSLKNGNGDSCAAPTCPGCLLSVSMAVLHRLDRLVDEVFEEGKYQVALTGIGTKDMSEIAELAQDDNSAPKPDGLGIMLFFRFVLVADHIKGNNKKATGDLRLVHTPPAIFLCEDAEAHDEMRKNDPESAREFISLSPLFQVTNKELRADASARGLLPSADVTTADGGRPKWATVH